MKGLILKELYLLRSFAKQYVIFMVMMVGFSVLMYNISFVATYIIVLSSTMVMSTTSMDEAVSFNRLAITMPMDTGEMVKSKYVILFISMAGGGAVIWLINALINAFPLVKRDLASTEGMLVVVCLFIAANAIAMPVMFKVGVAKARYTYIIVMLVMGTFTFGSYKLSQMAGISLDEMLESKEEMLNLTAVGFAVIVVIISYFISVKIVRKKEW